MTLDQMRRKIKQLERSLRKIEKAHPYVNFYDQELLRVVQAHSTTSQELIHLKVDYDACRSVRVDFACRECTCGKTEVVLKR